MVDLFTEVPEIVKEIRTALFIYNDLVELVIRGHIHNRQSPDEYNIG